MKLSVIIPALNEERYLGGTISALRNNSQSEGPYEIIVCDTGSSDRTAEVASGSGAVLIRNDSREPGKAGALNTGADYATGDVLLFLDADTTVPGAYDSLIEQALSDAGVVGGAFEFSLDGDEFGLRVVEFINRVRYRIRKRFYGDQGIFVRPEIFHNVGGFPQMPLLESAYLCRNLSRAGKLRLIKREIKTSPRRFHEGGIYKVLARDIKIWFLDLLGFSVGKYARDYWSANRRRSG